ncbi:F-box protein At4g22280-like [Carex rostrata]
MMNIKAHVSEENDDIDRITSLPDDVLTHILSFLSTRNAVQTCILSKGWINTWTFVPDLKFDIKEFGLPENIKGHEMCVQELVTKFELLVRNVLEKREAIRVNRFQLCLDSGVFWPCKSLADYIGNVMKLEPRECSMKLCSREKLNLDTDLIFTCASLIYVELCLSTIGRFFVAMELNSVNLPCLKTLKLDGITMSDDSFKMLLLGCHVLEELVLEHFNIGIMEICSNTLKKLVLGRNNYIVKRLQISTPNLQYLDISKLYDMRGNPLLNISSLVDASIYNIIDWHGRNVTMGVNLIHCLSNVVSLQINLQFSKRKIQKKDRSSLPVFKNLKYLKFVSCRFIAFDLPLYFLHHTPKLEELTLANIYKIRVTDFFDEETTLEGMGFVRRDYLKTLVSEFLLLYWVLTQGVLGDQQASSTNLQEISDLKQVAKEEQES